MTQLTELLGRLQAGDSQARDALFAAAYPELHRLARARLRDGGRHTLLDTTCLVHESYLRFVRAGELRAEDRRAFFAYASQVMRSVIVNSVRERIAQKRGGQMRYFGGYSEQEIAETLGVTERTVQRDWEKGRLILAAALKP
jgi:RNA polymerase sigma factor (TIGR02999 family)